MLFDLNTIRDEVGTLKAIEGRKVEHLMNQVDDKVNCIVSENK